MMLRVFTLLCFAFVGQVSHAGTLSWVSQDRWVTVAKVIDGDTFTTRKKEKVRLLGINTPEKRHETSAAEPFGQAAKLGLQKLIAGKQVRLSFDQERQDKYGRTLAHVYLRDGLWINAEMLRLGFAHVYTFAPNISAAKELIKFEQTAIQENKGIWQHKRWRVLKLEDLNSAMLGQFRLMRGEVSIFDKRAWRFKLGKLMVSVPKKYRKGFKAGLDIVKGEHVLVRGRLRMTRKGQWYMSIHTPSDISH